MAIKKEGSAKQYTIINNHLLKNTDLSLKAKGLLCLMFSLPEDWNFSTKGLTSIVKDGERSVRSTLKELEDNRYLIRKPIHDGAHIIDWEYQIFEAPYNQEGCNEDVQNQDVQNVHLRKSTQLNTNKLNTNIQNTNKYKKESKKKEFEDILSEIEDEDIVNALGEFINMRKAVKKPLTAHALELNIKHLFELSNDKTTMIAIIEQSVMHNWLIFYPLKEQSTSTSKQPQQSMYPNDFAF